MIFCVVFLFKYQEVEEAHILLFDFIALKNQLSNTPKDQLNNEQI